MSRTENNNSKDFIDHYRNIPLSEFTQKSDKNKSAIIKKMQNDSNITIETLAAYLGCNTQSLRNKLFRNSFSIDDFMIIAHACNYSVILKNDTTGEDFIIDQIDYFKHIDDKTLDRILDLDKKNNNIKTIDIKKQLLDLYNQYEELQSRLEEEYRKIKADLLKANETSKYM